MLVFDAKRFLRTEIGTAQEVHDLLASYSVDIPVSTIQKWGTRGSLPSDIWPILMLIAKAERWDLPIAKYFSEAKKQRPYNHAPVGPNGTAARKRALRKARAAKTA